METESEQNEREQHLEDSSTDIPVVRTNTPRPCSFEAYMAQNGQSGQIGEKVYGEWKHDARQRTDEMLAAFPHEAPSAPPVPEEVDEREESVGNDVTVEATPLPLSPSVAIAETSEQEFVWLFEYGIEMDYAFLNSPEHLNNAALLYGPAVLRGYTLTFAVLESQRQKVIATITPSPAAGAEVWGVVYRIPRRLIECADNGVSLLDRVHGVTLPERVYKRTEVVVTEAYRRRELSCLTYIATYAHRIAAATVTDTPYLKRLLEVLKKHQLPEDYIQSLPVSQMNGRATNGLHSTPVEQNTEPLPVVGGKQHSSTRPTSAEQVQPVQSVPGTPSAHFHSAGLVVFACFSGMLLLSALVLVVISDSGVAGNALSADFSPLHIPWYVMLYGLSGGSSSCLVTLGRRYERVRRGLPVVGTIVCCSRPFVGVVLAMLSYLLLNTGFFVLSESATQHVMLSSLLAALAGFCEGWLFKKQPA